MSGSKLLNDNIFLKTIQVLLGHFFHRIQNNVVKVLCVVHFTVLSELHRLYSNEWMGDC
jgi:hypothetical protein